jgi:iron complex outermembrane recepter protein
MIQDNRRMLVRGFLKVGIVYALLASAQAFGQDGSATLSGIVLDETGAAVSGVEVIVANTATGLQRSVTTDAAGAFTMPLLPSGPYVVTAQKEGFAAAQAQEIVLEVNEVTPIRIQLRVASLSETVMVTAQKRGEERLQDVPIPMTVVNTESLAASDQTHLRDYYATIPGLITIPGPGTGQKVGLTIRGIAPLGDIPTVAVMIDDVPYGSPAVLSAGHQPVPDIDPGDLTRIEVLRGPQGTLYGASSMGGLLKFVTADPSTDRFSGRVQGSFNGIYNGSTPGYSLRGSFNLPVSDTIAIRASGFTRRDSGYIDNPILGISGINEGDVAGGRVSALFRMSRTASLKLSALYENTDRKGLSEVLIRPDLGDLQQAYPPGVGYVKGTVQTYSGVLKADLGRVNLTSITGYNVYAQRDSIDGTSTFGAATQDLYGVGTVGFFDDRHTKKVSQEIRVSAPLGKRLDYILGAFYTHEDTELIVEAPALESSGAVHGPFYYRVIPSTYNEYAGFGDLTYRLSDRIDIQIGARQSRIRQSVEEFYTGPYVPIFLGTTSPFNTGLLKARSGPFTYLLTPRFRISPDIMVFTRFASGFRPGNANLGLSAASVALGVPVEFGPDKTQNYEVGIKTTLLQRRLGIDASLFYSDWNDVQLRQMNPLTRAAYTFNGGSAKSQGFELSVDLRPRDGMTIAGWAVYSDAVLTEDFPETSPQYGVAGDRLPINARFSGFFSARQDFPLWAGTRGFVSGQMSHIGDRLGNFRGFSAGIPLPRQEFPSYTQTDLRAGVLHASWMANLYVNNVGDVRGLIGGGVDGAPTNAFVYIQPRTLGLSITRTF